MRISDLRYNRDVRRYNLAFRLVLLGARTRTIVRWTQLSKYQVSALYRSYARQESAEINAKRRGKSPYRVEFCWRSAQMKWEAAVFGWMCLLAGVLPRERLPNPERTLPGIELGERLCTALEEYRELLRRDYSLEPQMTIEYAILLLCALARGDQAELGRCERCTGAIVVDRSTTQAQLCTYCGRASPTQLAGPDPTNCHPGLLITRST
jgi:hypothetical protein